MDEYRLKLLAIIVFMLLIYLTFLMASPKFGFFIAVVKGFLELGLVIATIAYYGYTEAQGEK